MTAKMTIADTDWTTEEQAKCWADDDTLTPEQCQRAADTAEAWLILHLHEQMRGWNYDGNGVFTGPADTEKAYGGLLAAWTDAIDYTIEHLDEIRAGN